MEMYKHQTRIFFTKAAKKHKNLEKKEKVEETLGRKRMLRSWSSMREDRGYIERENGMSREHTGWK